MIIENNEINEIDLKTLIYNNNKKYMGDNGN
jgi:hypothetical protein